jgi:hypothetical protein
MSHSLQFDFNVPITRLKHIRVKKNHAAIQGEPRLRQSLILAYQIEQIIADGQAKDFTEAAEWLNMTKARLSQIMNLINLSPTIQEEILLTDSPKLQNLSVDKVQHIAQKIDWLQQSQLWKDL